MTVDLDQPTKALASLRWIASYPRSGTTWVRLMLHIISGGGRAADGTLINAIEQTSREESDMRFFSPVVGNIGPYELMAVQRARAFVHSTIPAGTVLRTHCLATAFKRSKSARAIYMIRDPRDVAVSYARYSRCTNDLAIAVMGVSVACGPNTERNVAEPMGSWSSHVRSWAGTPRFRYEDLVADPAGQIQRIADALGIPCSPDQASEAAAETDLASLRLQEASCGFVESHPDGGEFFRLGKPGEWRTALTEAQAAQIERDHGEVMKEEGYTTCHQS